jgi:DNA-binding FadR family transcriptional regulator
MGVSRSPVREALQALSREGLTTLEPRRGARAATAEQAATGILKHGRDELLRILNNLT